MPLAPAVCFLSCTHAHSHMYSILKLLNSSPLVNRLCQYQSPWVQCFFCSSLVLQLRVPGTCNRPQTTAAGCFFSRFCLAAQEIELGREEEKYRGEGWYWITNLNILAWQDSSDPIKDAGFTCLDRSVPDNGSQLGLWWFWLLNLLLAQFLIMALCLHFEPNLSLSSLWYFSISPATSQLTSPFPFQPELSYEGFSWFPKKYQCRGSETLWTALCTFSDVPAQVSLE